MPSVEGRLQIVWTPAHRTRQQAQSSDDLDHYTGNFAVDLAAKEAAQRFQVSPELQDAFWDQHKWVKEAAMAATAAVLNYVVLVKPIKLGSFKKLSGQKEGKPRHQFTFSFMLNLWICLACGQVARVNPYRRCLAVCHRLHPVLRDLVLMYKFTELGHKLYIGRLSIAKDLQAGGNIIFVFNVGATQLQE